MSPDSRVPIVSVGPEHPQEPSLVFTSLRRKIYVQPFEEEGRRHETKLMHPHLPKDWKSPRGGRLLPVTHTAAHSQWTLSPAVLVFCCRFGGTTSLTLWPLKNL